MTIMKSNLLRALAEKELCTPDKLNVFNSGHNLQKQKFELLLI